MKNIPARLEDILDMISTAQDALRGVTYESYRYGSEHKHTRMVIERAMEIISEASKVIPPEQKARFPHVPWPAIVSIGNRLRHEYFRVDHMLLYNIAKENLNGLEAAVKTMLKEQS